MADKKEELDLTTIEVLRDDSARLDALKVHPKQPTREIITMLLDEHESNRK